MTCIDTEETRAAIQRILNQNIFTTGKSIAATLGMHERTVQRIIAKYGLRGGQFQEAQTEKALPKKPQYSLGEDIRLNSLQLENSQLKTKYKKSLEELANLESIVNTLIEIPKEPCHVPIALEKKGKREVVPVIVASDWHIEETVTRGATNGMNEYNLDIAEESIKQFFANAIYLVNREKRDSTVKTVVVSFLGDIINGVLRSEDLQNNAVTSIDAMTIARSLIYSGLKKMMGETKCKIRVICCVGNHGRLTEKIFHSNQVHNSLEYLMYKTLERDFKEYPDVDFFVSESYYCMMDILGMSVRFHHGHNIKFLGGIGGLAVPVLRKIAQMNLTEKADLDVCGHFHSMQIFSNCILNGSLVGANGYSMSLGLPFEPPRQLFFLIDSKYGRTSIMPIFIDR